MHADLDYEKPKSKRADKKGSSFKSLSSRSTDFIRVRPRGSEEMKLAATAIKLITELHHDDRYAH
jgi:hypothetical protein